MKAVFIPDSKLNIDKLNQDLKDCIDVIQSITVANGVILICSNHTRKDKLKEIQKKVKE